jgi:hypothetical protein
MAEERKQTARINGYGDYCVQPSVSTRPPAPRL